MRFNQLLPAAAGNILLFLAACTGGGGAQPDCSYQFSPQPEQPDSALLRMFFQAEGLEMDTAGMNTQEKFDYLVGQLPPRATAADYPKSNDPRSQESWLAALAQVLPGWGAHAHSSGPLDFEQLFGLPRQAYYQYFGVRNVVMLAHDTMEQAAAGLVVWEKEAPADKQHAPLSLTYLGYHGPVHKSGRFTLVQAANLKLGGPDLKPLPDPLVTAFKTLADCPAESAAADSTNPQTRAQPDSADTSAAPGASGTAGPWCGYHFEYAYDTAQAWVQQLSHLLYKHIRINGVVKHEKYLQELPEWASAADAPPTRDPRSAPELLEHLQRSGLNLALEPREKSALAVPGYLDFFGLAGVYTLNNAEDYTPHYNLYVWDKNLPADKQHKVLKAAELLPGAVPLHIGGRFTLSPIRGSNKQLPQLSGEQETRLLAVFEDFANCRGKMDGAQAAGSSTRPGGPFGQTLGKLYPTPADPQFYIQRLERQGDKLRAVFSDGVEARCSSCSLSPGALARLFEQRPAPTPSGRLRSSPKEDFTPEPVGPDRQGPLVQQGQWQVEVTWSGRTLNRNDLPPEVQAPGKLVAARRWQDRNGYNLLLLYTKTTNQPARNGQPATRSKHLFGKLYLRQPDDPRYNLQWDIRDFQQNCPRDMDLTLEVLPPLVYVTDLDLDGYTETTLRYRKQCASDVQPYRVKILMHENGTKYALRGWSATPYAKSRLEETPDFVPGPAVFGFWAKKLWRQE